MAMITVLLGREGSGSKAMLLKETQGIYNLVLLSHTAGKHLLEKELEERHEGKILCKVVGGQGDLQTWLRKTVPNAVHDEMI